MSSNHDPSMSWLAEYAKPEVLKKYKLQYLESADEADSNTNRFSVGEGYTEEEFKSLREQYPPPDGKNPGYVYLVQSPTTAYKIGRTTRPNDRRKRFEVNLPFEIEFVAVIRTGDCHKLEKNLHKLFDQKRIKRSKQRGGEWFRLTDADVEYIKRRDIKRLNSTQVIRQTSNLGGES